MFHLRVYAKYRGDIFHLADIYVWVRVGKTEDYNSI